MKKIFTLLLIITILSTSAQLVEDSVTCNAQYASQSFYSLLNGEVANIDNKNWDISFSMSGEGADGSAIWLNELNGDLWASPGDTSTWVGFDTTGFLSWNKLMNSDEAYKNGAFNKHRGTGPNGTFDMGWGYLDPSNNFWTFGDSLYLWKNSADEFKKIWIVSLKSGIWDFKYANIDGTDEQSFTITKADYPKRNFVYFSLENNAIVDREPDNDTWDITFIGQKDELFPDSVISSAQVFSNRNIWTSKSYKDTYSDAIATTVADSIYTKQINNIGREWKSFSGGVWSIYDTIAYFIYDQDSTIYRMVFTGFGGNATGKSFFNKEVIDLTDAIYNVENVVSYSVYPNPAQNNVSVLVKMGNSEDFSINIYNLIGHLVYTEKIHSASEINHHSINISDFNSGMYIVEIKGNNFSATEKLFIK